MGVDFEGRRLDADSAARLIRRDVARDSHQEEGLFLPDSAFDAPEAVAAPAPAPALSRSRTIDSIKPLLVIVAIVSEFVSSWYTFSWYRNNQPVALAAILAAVLGVCEALLPELSILLFKKGRAAILGSAIVMALAVIATTFSMGATIGGMYNARSKTLATANKDTAAALSYAAKSKILLGQRDRAVAAVQGYSQDELLYAAKVVELVANNENASGMEAKRDRARAARAKAEADLRRTEGELLALGANEESSVIIRDDFYSFLAQRAPGASPEAVEFIMIAFPAIFNEIVAPAMLTIAMFL